MTHAHGEKKPWRQSREWEPTRPADGNDGFPGPAIDQAVRPKSDQTLLRRFCFLGHEKEDALILRHASFARVSALQMNHQKLERVPWNGGPRAPESCERNVESNDAKLKTQQKKGPGMGFHETVPLLMVASRVFHGWETHDLTCHGCCERSIHSWRSAYRPLPQQMVRLMAQSEPCREAS